MGDLGQGEETGPEESLGGMQAEKQLKIKIFLYKVEFLVQIVFTGVKPRPGASRHTAKPYPC